MRPISLHHLCVLELDAVGLVHHAADAGFDQVCLFTQPPPVSLLPPLVTRENEAAVRQALADRGLSVCNLEIFYLAEDTDPADFLGAMEIGARLGGRLATIVIGDPDRQRALDNFARTCALMAEFGIRPNLEFFAFSAIHSLPEALAVLRDSGRSEAGLVIDMLHIMRTGASVADLAALDPGLIGYIQLNDGPSQPPADLLDEAINNRMVPGEGAFPLRALLDSLPADTPLSLEVPLNDRRAKGEDAAQRSRVLARAARSLLGGG